MMIRAITFDLWDTLVIDDSDEAHRAAAGRPSKKEERESLFVDEVLAHHDLPRETVVDALAQANARFRHQWKVEHRTPHIRERLRYGFEVLGLEPTPGFEGMVEAYAWMEVHTPPDKTANVRQMLESLHGTYPLGIISDAIVTPGAQLRELLAKHGLAKFFDVFVFSDEAGASKPDASVFEIAAKALGVQPHEIAHVGDREGNDIAGPLNVGGTAILYTGAVDRGSDETAAQIVCHDMADLPALIADYRKEQGA